MIRCQRTPNEWFAEAARCYEERHQGCAWCGGFHRVFRTQRDGVHEYFCHGCDFRAIFDSAANHYSCFPGEETAAFKPPTMHDD